jgi:hypothetical protein
MQYQNQPRAAQLIRAAIAAAGRSPTVARRFGLSVAAVNAWAKRGNMPADRIVPLCEMGGHAVQPMQLLEAITREREAA